MNGGRKMWILIFCLVIAGILGGGYYVSVSALVGVVLLGVLFYQLYVKKQITAAWDLNMVAFAILVFGYLMACLWAVDSEMALMGVVKFLPYLLFYVLVSGNPEEREKMISYLPMLACLMTIFSFTMMQFEIFRDWVTVAGRLAGFFQYPNTYAIFLLVCLILLLWRLEPKHLAWLDVIYAVVAVFGIILSGSRTVFLLTIVAVVWMVLARGTVRKIIVPIFVFGAVATIVLVFIGGSTDVLSRFTDISFGASTFLGRILYVRDALTLIMKHPFGLGYYGYYFIQQSVQTGVYSVVNVHNELVQILLDVGVLPAAVMCAAIVRTIVTRRTSSRNRMVLVILLLHSLFDYDFQFIAMGFVLILFLDMRNVQKKKVPVFTGTLVAVGGIGMAAISVLCGVSDVCYTSGNYENAVRVYSGNTLAQLELLKASKTTEEMKTIAKDILQHNQASAFAYSAMAWAAFAEGDVEEFAQYKEKAIEFAPYQYEEYVDYLEILAYCGGKYLDIGDEAGAKFCLEKAEKIPEMLNSVKENTSALGWKIVDRPKVVLSQEHLELIEEMRKNLEE